MAIYSSKSHLLVTLEVFMFFLLLVSKVKSDTFSFNFPRFDYEPDAKSILCVDDACIAEGVLQLTVRDNSGVPLQHSVGRAVYFSPVQIYDNKTEKVADFTTELSFDVDTGGASEVHGDGTSFFITSLDFDFPNNSGGGYLGIFSPETALNTSENRIVAVEFDRHRNEWDLNPSTRLPLTFPHVGIDINSIESVATAPWSVEEEEDGVIGKAKISYDSKTKEFSVSLEYANSQTPFSRTHTRLSYVIDLRTILPEWVGIGFSAATGQLTERHNILSWSFNSTL